MKSIDKIVSSIKSSGVPIVDWIERLPKLTHRYSDQLLVEIAKLNVVQDPWLLECLLLIASRDGLTKSYTRILCDLLKYDWHESHEDIVMMLEEIRDPSCINALYETALTIPNYDDGRGLARKCIWALGAINTELAVEKLITLSSNQDPIISEVARMQLDSRT